MVYGYQLSSCAVIVRCDDGVHFEGVKGDAQLDEYHLFELHSAGLAHSHTYQIVVKD